MIRRLGSASVAAAALGGAITSLVPQHAASLLLLAAGTLVVVAAAFLLVLAGPLVTTGPPATALDVAPGRAAPTLEPQGLRDARRDLSARAGVGSLPRSVHQRLLAAGVAALPPPDSGQGSAVAADVVAALVHRLLDDPDHTVPEGGHR